jgi:hypothetical protein
MYNRCSQKVASKLATYDLHYEDNSFSICGLLTTNAGRHLDQEVQMKKVQMKQELLWIFNKHSTMGESQSMDSSGRHLIFLME